MTRELNHIWTPAKVEILSETLSHATRGRRYGSFCKGKVGLQCHSDVQPEDGPSSTIYIYMCFPKLKNLRTKSVRELSCVHV